MTNKRARPTVLAIDPAFQKLLRKNGNPHATCEWFNTALRTGRGKLFANGAVTSPDFFASHLRVAITAAPGGGWVAKMTALRALDRPDYEWTVDIDNLLFPRRPPGRKPKYAWVDAEITRRCHDEAGNLRMPDNEAAFTEEIIKMCDETEHGPADNTIRRKVRRVLRETAAGITADGAQK